jgi:DNA-binding winged helix-turn-helix (wHTH) protein
MPDSTGQARSCAQLDRGAAVREFPPFKLDTVNQCLWRRTGNRDDERILLTPKAFGILAYLVDHAGRLVKQDEMLGALWPQSYVQPEVLKHHILEIRKALGDNPRKPSFIETLPRRGYRFIAAVSSGPALDQAATLRPVPNALVGRGGALKELRDCLGQASHGQRQIVFITGEPGIGKTALVDEFQRHAMAGTQGVRIARGQCVEGYGGKEAYYPMLEALGQLCRESHGEEIIRILAAQAPTWLVQFPALLKREHREVLQREILGATRERMLREIGEAIALIAEKRPLLIIFEDLQWVDHATVDLLSALARRRSPTQMMLMGTYRPVDLAFGEHPLKMLKQELLAHQLCREVALDPLEEAEVAEYLTLDTCQAAPPEGLARLIHRHTGGNPLFMVAALDNVTRRGFISRESGCIQLQIPLEELELGVPESLRQMIEVQIERLSAEEQRALEWASVEGALFTAKVSAAAAGLQQEEFEELCEELSRRQQIVRAAGSRRFPDGSVAPQFEFSHTLYRDVLYGRQSSGRRARSHVRIGERLENLFSATLGGIAAELAHHFEEGLDWPRAVTYLQLAADVGGRRYAHREPTFLLRHALELTRRLPDAQRSKSDSVITEKLANIYAASFDARALDTYSALIAKAAHVGRTDVQLRALVGMTFFLSWINSERALEVIERALRVGAAQSDPIRRAKTRVTFCCWRLLVSHWDVGVAEECGRALAEIEQAGDRLSLARHKINFSFIQWASSAYREAHDNAVGSRAVLFEGNEENFYLSRQYWASRVIESWSLMLLGEWGNALGESESAIAILTKNGDDHRLEQWRLYRAWIYLHALDHAAVQAMCDEIFPLVTGQPASIYRYRVCLILAGSADAVQGNFDRAYERLSAAREEMSRQSVLLDWYWSMQLESGLTELWLARGDLAKAREQAQVFVASTMRTSERTWQALAWEVSARVAMAESRDRDAHKCISSALSTIEGLEAPLAAWRVHATAAEYYACTKSLELAETHFHLSKATILQLANSLPSEAPLRNAFLTSPLVARVFAGLAPPVTPARDELQNDDLA